MAEITDKKKNTKSDQKDEDFSWSGTPDKICRICKKEIKGTIIVYLHEPYHGECMYPGP